MNLESGTAWASTTSTEDQDDAIFNALPASMSVRWRKAVQELLVTERNYVNELGLIMRGYIHVIPDHVSTLKIP